MTTAKAIMTQTVITLSPDTLVSDAIARLEQHGISGAPVIDKIGGLLGVVSVKDLLRASGAPVRGGHQELSDFYGRPASTVVHEVEGGVDLAVQAIMSKEPITVDEDAPLSTVADTMLKHGIHRVLVTDASKLTGIVSALDFVRLHATDPVAW